MSPQLADDLNNLAGKVHAISHTPEPCVSTPSPPPPIAAMTPETATTLERKKRKAPKPPEFSQQPSVNEPTMPQENSAASVVLPANKRQAPKAPQALFIASDKPPPCFVPPPPPDEPPPDSFSSPVGPLSPKSLGMDSFY